MPKRLTLEPHLTVEELKQRYLQASGAIEARHYQSLWLLAAGKTSQEVADLTGYSLGWLYEIVRSYNRQGSEALGDKRSENRGAKPLLNDYQQGQLWQTLQEPHPDGGVWNGPKVAVWMSELLGHPVHPQRGWEYFKELRYRLRRPRPDRQEPDKEEQNRRKKNARRRRVS